METAGVAVLGVGNIGGEVARRLSAAHEAESATGRAALRLVKFLDRDPEIAERAGLDPELHSTDGFSVVDDPAVQVVVETLGGEQPAADLMIRALAQGKHVVTANKEAVAKNLPAIIAAARDGDAGFLCEASVGGGIPILVSLRQILAANKVESIRGILNGTTNYILHKMDSEGADYTTALAEAQDLGYAEPDPTADVEGFDAAYKLAILASLMSGRYIHPDEVERTGISDISVDDVKQAQARGGTVRLIAEARRTDSKVSLKVAPTVVPATDLFSRVVANYNALEIVGDRVGAVWLHGQGAGPAPTASAIISDILEAVNVGSAATPVL